MGKQLLIAVETDKKAKTDELYIQELILHEYGKITKIIIKYQEMQGCTKLNALKRNLDKLTKDYARMASDNETYVICCFDTDDYDKDREDVVKLKAAKDFCEQNEYEFVWLCRDVEEVFWKMRVENSKKKEYAKKFKTNNQYEKLNKDNLRAASYSKKKSNILTVFDKYLKAGKGLLVND